MAHRSSLILNKDASIGIAIIRYGDRMQKDLSEASRDYWCSPDKLS